jgi:hypothetical protein
MTVITSSLTCRRSPFQPNATDAVSFFFAPWISPFDGEVTNLSLSTAPSFELEVYTVGWAYNKNVFMYVHINWNSSVL